MTYQIIVEGDDLIVCNNVSSTSKEYRTDYNHSLKQKALCKVAKCEIPVCCNCGCNDIRLEITIEVVDEQSKLDPLLTQIKRRVGDNGLVTIQEVYGL